LGYKKPVDVYKKSCHLFCVEITKNIKFISVAIFCIFCPSMFFVRLIEIVKYKIKSKNELFFCVSLV
jgi:hypothetical protein